MKVLTFNAFRKRVRCGFELETQESNGVTWDNRSTSRMSGAYPYYHETVDTPNFEEIRAALADTRIEIGHDGSVEGFEFRTYGPNTIRQFRKAAERVFKIRHRIDHQCSFHVHMSISGVRLDYSPFVQSTLIEYVIKHRFDLPKSVRKRLSETDHIEEYAAISEEGPNQNTFVSFNTRYCTWEFRCFGNVHNVDDAVACLDLAIKAMYAAQSSLMSHDLFGEYYKVLANMRSRKFAVPSKRKKRKKPQRRIAA